jgi:hypothetical protein
LATRSGDLVDNATWIHPYASPAMGSHCLCINAHFDIDRYGRLFVPNALARQVEIPAELYHAVAELLAFFQRLNGDLGLTVIIVTHDMGEAFALADRVGVLEDGRLIANERAAAVAASTDPRIRRLLDALPAIPRESDVVPVLKPADTGGHDVPSGH